MTAPNDGEKAAVEFVLIYRYEWCYDDGGIGHDSGWKEAERRLEATSATAARTEARTFTLNGMPCGSFGCGNRGRRQIVRIEKRESKVTVLR